MILTEIEYQGFRNLTDASLEFAPERNVIVGDNGMGKTNLLEAVFYSALASSFRTSDERCLIKTDQGHLRVAGRTARHEACVYYNGEKRMMIDGVVKPRLGDYVGWMPVVMLSLDDIWIVWGPPARRRAYLDWLLAKLRPTYLSDLGVFRRILRQRNHLLQDITVDPDLLAACDQTYLNAANAVYRARQAVLPALTAEIQEQASALGLGPLRVAYVGTCADMHLDASHLDARRQRDLSCRETTVGPHRDDLALLLGDHPLKDYGSEGEARAVAIALRLAERRLLEEKDGDPPVILLDEAAAELDMQHRLCLAALLRGQVFYASTTNPEFLGMTGHRTFSLKRGTVEVS